MMYPYGTLPVQPNTSQPQYLQHSTTPTQQPASTWSVAQTDMTAATASPTRPSASAPACPSTQLGPGQMYPEYNWQNTSGSSDYYSVPAMYSNSWCQKLCGEMDFPNVDPDMPDFNPGLMSHDEDSPIIDLRQYGGMGNYMQDSTRRYSDNVGPMPNSGLMPDMSTYEDLSESETVSYAASDYDWSGLDTQTHLLSPLTSPGKQDHNRSGSRSRNSPGPASHHSYNNSRTSPYTLDSNRYKRWSTGVAPTSTPAPAPAHSVHQAQDRFMTYGQQLNPHHSLPAYPTNTMTSHPTQSQYMLSPQPQMQSNAVSYFPSPERPYSLEVPRPVPSQGMYRLLQSNDHQHPGCSAHFADFADPPDLYSSLHEEPCDPPEEDMNPSDPDMVPKEQDLRFAGDLYTPKWVRGHGNKREGWCGLCKPGRWLVLKNSAFWYDKSFTHGVSAATGAAFQGPQETRRTEGNLDVWEGLCGSCAEWIPLVSSKKKGTTWFRHAYKCHTHPKVKDGPKRRRETSNQVRNRAGSNPSPRQQKAPHPSSAGPMHQEPPSRYPFGPGAESMDTASSSAGSTPRSKWPSSSDNDLVGIPRSAGKGGFGGWPNAV
ncbi:uncharacterized protein K452DRAFT_300104 [Aplosporella prunicola CBS 121167]|uniref:Transcription regulator Rua1 C-terminal domain-containing protein n=1 Tax=Aplosporella prunicola CBS 121167 TaxID=1176127 RepID=A0A6A6B8M8_9PEZI|nr:uncharacterized protein K452DRAFT_300104 [Aplosporella prunicola CBS 121167]KAF2139544.1 hypothetical protein K452DRAFT_300104 [Aplosporella prunicola CBS 121167]